jgi:hypothetical protein
MASSWCIWSKQIGFTKIEMERLRQGKVACERALARLEDYVIETIENLGADDKGGYRKLEGKTTTFSLRALSAIGGSYGRVRDPGRLQNADNSSCPALTWEQLLDGLEIEQRAAVLGQARHPEVSVDNARLRRQWMAVQTFPAQVWSVGTPCGGLR